MKNLILLTFLFITVGSFAQIEAVKVNNSNNVHLIFDNVIKAADVGNNKYFILFDPGDKVLVVKGIKADKTNLFVTTTDGLMYNILIEYSEQIDTYYKSYTKKDAINYVPVVNEVVDVTKKDVVKNPVQKPKETSKKQDSTYNVSSIKSAKNLYINDKKEYMRKIAAALTGQKNFYTRSFVERNNIVLQLMNIVYNKKELYFYFEMENKGGVDFDIDYFTYAIATKNLKKRSNSQAEFQEPIYTYKLPKRLKGNAKIRFVVVFNEFNIGKNKVFIVEAKDGNGERDIYIPISSKQLNNPNTYKS